MKERITVLGSLCLVGGSAYKHTITINMVNTAIVLKILWEPGESQQRLLFQLEAKEEKTNQARKTDCGSRVYSKENGEKFVVAGTWVVCERRSLALSQITSGLLRFTHFSPCRIAGFNIAFLFTGLFCIPWFYRARLGILHLGLLSPCCRTSQVAKRSAVHMAEFLHVYEFSPGSGT